VPVKWNRNKRVYDGFVATGVALYLAVFLLVGSAVDAAGFPILLIRSLGTCAYVMLHVLLVIGPLARLDRRFLPLVYNRRHFGVATFFVASGHVVGAVGYYHGFGVLNPLRSLLSLPGPFPFEWFGLAVFLVLFLMAATSHDFWQKTIAPGVWKSLHMLVYPAYLLLVLHVMFGALKTEVHQVVVGLVGLGFVLVAGLQICVGLKERYRDGRSPLVRVPPNNKWVEVGTVDEIPENRAKLVCLPGKERIALFRYDGCVSAVTNVCAHQRGPLGEGKIVNGCISCPWHGWEYKPGDGCSPPPFREKITIFRTRVDGRRVLIDPTPLLPGTPVEPSRFEVARHG
jgi:nitrite reductase/ring-hydroxylating ferredoxin subunit/DMSO/TMAO reductase YedYZ heme-binding membrane subunit